MATKIEPRFLDDLSSIYVPQAEVGAASGVASLDVSGKVPLSQLPSSLLEYKGQWDPSTNTPTLADGAGTSGFAYIVSVMFAGPVSGLNSPTMVNFEVGNLVIYNGSQWEQAASATGVTSVNGAVGAVTVNAINQLTGDVLTTAASQSQSKVATLATVNSNIGSFTNANITVNNKGLITAASNGTNGTVTSVALADTSTTPIYTIGNSPITISGTLDFSLNSQIANTFLLGPNSGSPAQPTFRALTVSDIPANTITYGRIQQESSGTLLGNPTGSSANPSEITLGTGLSFSGSVLSVTGGGVNAINQLTGDVTAGPASGSQSEAATVAKIQGTTVSGTTGTGNVVFSASPTLTGTVVATTISGPNPAGAITVTAGTVASSSTGGTVTINSGTGGTGSGTAGQTGGTTNVNGGTGGAGSSTSGNGGGATLKGGSGGGGVAGGTGGTAQLVGGTGGTGSSLGGNGGAANVQGGSPASIAGSGGGSVTVAAGGGSGTGSGGIGGTVTISTGTAGGDNTVSNSGGSLTLSCGHSIGSSGGPNVTLTAGTGGIGTGTAGANGGNTNLNAGNGGQGSTTGGTGGNVVISAGTGGSSPTPGAGGFIQFMPAATTTNAERFRITATECFASNSQLEVKTAGFGLGITHGSNCKLGTTTLSGGTATVSNTAVTSNSIIFLTTQSNGGSPGAVYVSAKTAGTSFVITSTSATDSSTVGWFIVEGL